MNQPNASAATVHAFLTAVQQGNQEQLASLLHPAVEWHQPGRHRFSGTYNSSAEVFAMVGGMYQVSEGSFALTDIKTIAVNGNSVACLLHFTASRPGAVLDTDNIDVYTVQDGKITAAKVYVTNPAQEDAFWRK
jgi:ketosteroid isomerase-like protein